MNPSKFYLLSLIITFFIFGCTKKDDGGAPKENPKICSQSFKKASCEFTATEGFGMNLYTNSNSTFTTLFGKKLAAPPVEAMMQASVKSIIEYIQGNGSQLQANESSGMIRTQLFKIQNNCGCQMFESLKEAPARISKTWKDTVVGLFIPSEEMMSINGLNLPSVSVVSDTDKWTLVHEYMHNLFNDYRVNVQKQKTGTALKADVKSSGQKMDSLLSSVYDPAENKYKFRKGVSNSSKLEFSRALRLFAENLTEMLKAYTLEEITIESFLINSYENHGQTSNKLMFVPQVAPYYAASYIDSSYSKAIRFFNFLLNGLYIDEDGKKEYSLGLSSVKSELMLSAIELSNTEIGMMMQIQTEVAELDSLVEDLSVIQRSMEDVVKYVSKPYMDKAQSAEGASMLGLTSIESSSDNLKKSCSHDLDLHEFLNK